MSIFSSNSMFLMEKSIDYLWQKQMVSANNVTNSETPNFKSSYVTFEEEMRQHIGQLREPNARRIRQRISEVSPRVHTTYDEVNKMDNSNVDLVAEQTELAKSGIQYEYATRAISDDYMRLRTAIKGQ